MQLTVNLNMKKLQVPTVCVWESLHGVCVCNDEKLQFADHVVPEANKRKKTLFICVLLSFYSDAGPRGELDLTGYLVAS